MHVNHHLIFGVATTPYDPPMVDISGLPPPPHSCPDPRAEKSFSDWVRALTIKGSGVTQRQLALAAGTTPQAVTKWIKGGRVEVENLSRIAEWVGLPYSQLRMLVDEPKLRVSPHNAPDEKAAYALASSELQALWAKLNSTSKHQLIGMAKALLSEQKKVRPK